MTQVESRRQKWVDGLILLPILLCVVIPNSLKVAAIISLALAGIIAATRLKINKDSQRVLVMYIISATVTSFFLIIGISNNAPIEAVTQVLAIYVIAPGLWLAAVFYAFQRLGNDALANFLGKLTPLCCFSVVIFVVLYQTLGRESVSFFIAEDKANFQWDKGYSGATMHVFGSMIFLTGAVLAAPSAIKNKLLRYFSIASLTMIAILSGRSALLLSIFLGIGLGLLIGNYEGIGTKKRKSARNSFIFILSLIVIIFPAYLIDRFTDFDLTLAISDFWVKIISGGGEERTEQFSELTHGAASNYFLGAGHGVGVALARSDDFPWRYELIWLATIFRVGIIGFLLYSSVFIYYFAKIAQRFINKSHSPADVFFFSGFVCAIAASFTNPYIEAFAFQWMFIIPLAAEFATNSKFRKNNNS